ncbi:2-dehydropantoate 2-reductase [Viridothelium virens]|uniref:2-dehydropantoate 2-reductase n=1 Tax=Viridothelium virens TaxID=1048519 RepID=A0A6A6H9A0_VIRVR|nr:2-dehydropantoate 2-reductase [Viridothelium virens]
MPKVLLFGAGAVGSVYAYLFSKAGAAVTAVCRSNYSAAKANGFTIRSSLFGNVQCSPSIVRSVNDANGPFDYVILCSKAFPGSKPSTAEIIKPAVGPKTAIALLQNGIGIEEEYREAFPENPIISCVVYCPATEVESGVIEHGEVERLEVGTFPHDASAEHKQAAHDFVALLRRAGGTAEFHEDVQVQRWSKLLVNASWNPICALSRSSDVKFMMAAQSNVSWVRLVMLEIMAVAQAYGYSSINEELLDWQLGRAKARMNGPGIEPSMLADVKKGRRIEVEAIVGNTVRLAERKGVQVTLLESLYALGKGLDESIARSTAGN